MKKKRKKKYKKSANYIKLCNYRKSVMGRLINFYYEKYYMKSNEQVFFEIFKLNKSTFDNWVRGARVPSKKFTIEIQKKMDKMK